LWMTALLLQNYIMKLLSFEISLYLYSFVHMQTNGVWVVPLLQFGWNFER
jgi:hypothetical protein